MMGAFTFFFFCSVTCFRSMYGKGSEILTWFLPCTVRPVGTYITTAPRPVLFCVWRTLCVCDERSQRPPPSPCYLLLPTSLPERKTSTPVYRTHSDWLPVPSLLVSLSVSHSRTDNFVLQEPDHTWLSTSLSRSVSLNEKTGSLHLHSHFLSHIICALSLPPPSPAHENKAS